MSTSSLTLEQLIALNDELVAITRMGVPLELGLRGLGHELPGQLGQVTETLQQKMDSGQDLGSALSDSAAGIPPAYQAIVRAGIESGRLSTALESVAESARRVGEVRRGMRIAFFYPLTVTILAYLVFVWSVVQWSPILVEFYEDGSFSTLPIFSWMLVLRDTAKWWAPVLPLVFVLPLALWYYRSRRSTDQPLHSLRHLSRVATFTELLASMVENAVPLPRALSVAADASGSRAIERECHQWAAQIERGEAISADAQQQSAVPVWIAWLLQHGSNHARLANNLRQAARAYQNDVLRRSRWLARVFPIWVTILVGGTATLLTAVLVAGPWFYVLFRLE